VPARTRDLRPAFSGAHTGAAMHAGACRRTRFDYSSSTTRVPSPTGLSGGNASTINATCAAGETVPRSTVTGCRKQACI
jgi:hypothetical protein